MIGRIYVCLRVDHQHASGKVDVETLMYSESKDDALRFMELVSAKDAFGKNWNYDIDGDPFFEMGDLEDDEGQETERPPLPDERFLMWDEDERDDKVLDRPTSVVASISLYSSKSEDPERSLLRAYKLCKTDPSVESFVKTTTEGDLELVRQVTGQDPRVF